MNFSKFDVSVLVVMTLAVIIMSFMFPALGLADEDAVNETDVPTYNISENTFDLTGTSPDRPQTATSGELQFNQSDGNSITGVNVIWINEPRDTGTAIELQNTSTDGFDFVLTNFTSTGSSQTRQDITSEGQQFTVQDYDYTIQVRIKQLDNLNQANMTAVAEYDIKSAPEDDQGISSIPIVGGVGDTIAQWVGFIGVMFAYISLFIVELGINAISILATIGIFFVRIGIFLFGTYTAIVGSANTWAAAVLLVPGILIGLMFAKLSVIMINLLPTT